MKKHAIIALLGLLILLIALPTVSAAPMMTPVPSEMMVTVFYTRTATRTATQTQTETPTPEPPICLEITRRTGVRQWPSLWSVSTHYLDVGTRVYIEEIVNNQDDGLGPFQIPARFARLGRYAHFAVEVRGTDYARVCR